MRRTAIPVFLLFALFAASTLSGVTVAAADPAGGDLRPSGPLDAKIRARAGGSIGVEAREIATLAPGDDLRVGWEKFAADHEGTWKVYLDERTALPTLVSGRGIEWFVKDAAKAMDLQQVEARVRTFLAENEDLLGDWSTLLDFDVEASRELRHGHWQIVFRQLVDGVRVENARLEFHVNQGRLSMFGATHWGVPTTNGVPSIDVDQARIVLDAHLGVTTALYEQVEKPELTLMALDPAPALDGPGDWHGVRGEGLAHALIWRLRFLDPDTAQLWVGEVNAHDGTLLSFFDGTHYNSIRGGVFPISNDGDCASGGCEIDGFPMPFSDMTEDGQPVDHTDAFGNMQCVVSTSPVTTALDGPYLRVSDRCGVTSESGTCDEGIDLGMNPGADCAIEDGASTGNTAAARSSFYHINRAAEVARFYDSANTWLRNPVTVHVNIPSTCNAFWNGDINMYGSGNGCGNTGQQQGVLVHEWGHGYDENDGGGFDTTSEAYADVVAIFAARDSCVSRGWYNDGRTCTGYGDTCLTCTGIRDHDWAAREFNAPTTPAFVNTYCPMGPGGPCGKESHCESYPISESIYDLATRDLPASGMDPDSAWQLAERLWYETRPGSGGNIYLCLRGVGNSCATTSWYQRMRVADDDDGDLSNGTPHAAELHAAFGRHKIACGQASAPENQSTSSCPSLTTPVLTLTETGSGTELSWGAVAGAAEYRVYQSDLGCDRQQVPIASLTGGETSFVDGVAFPDLPGFYRIEAFGSNHACSSAVSDCEATPGGARLQKNTHRIVESGPPPPSGFPDPGETFTMPVTLFNGGLGGAAGVTGQLSLVDPTQGTVTDPDATWGDLDVNVGLESDDPHFEVAVAETVSCGDLLTFDLDMLAANAATRTRRFQVQLGVPRRDFTNDVSQEIPLETTTPVTSTIVVDQDKSISDLDISVNISHGMTTELIVEVTSPAGTTVRLHDRTDPPGSAIRARFDAERAPDGPGTMADFEGESVEGTWTLSIEDVGLESTGTGTLQDWTLHATVSDGFDCQPASCAEPPPTETADNLHVELSPNGPQLDLLFAWDPVASAAGYHVIQSTSPSFGASEVAGATSGATTLTLDDGANTTPSLTFFKVRAVNSCGQEGP